MNNITSLNPDGRPNVITVKCPGSIGPDGEVNMRLSAAELQNIISGKIKGEVNNNNKSKWKPVTFQSMDAIFSRKK